MAGDAVAAFIGVGTFSSVGRVFAPTTRQVFRSTRQQIAMDQREVVGTERVSHGNDNGDDSGSSSNHTRHGGRSTSASDEDDQLTFFSGTTVKASNMDPSRPEHDSDRMNSGAGDTNNHDSDDGDGRNAAENGTPMDCSVYCKQLREVVVELCGGLCIGLTDLCIGVAKICGGMAKSLLDLLEALVNPSGFRTRREDSSRPPDLPVQATEVQASEVDSTLT